jgi:hypothetical protein
MDQLHCIETFEKSFLEIIEAIFDVFERVLSTSKYFYVFTGNPKTLAESTAIITPAYKSSVIFNNLSVFKYFRLRFCGIRLDFI